MPPEEDHPAGDREGFAHLGEEERFRGWRISVVDATFRSPDGALFHRHVVRHPGAVAVVAVTDRAGALLVRQYRGPVDRWLLEIPAGTRDVDGEPAELTARRELAEEAGVHPARLEVLATIYNTPGFCDEQTVVFLATGLSPVALKRHGPEEEHMEVVEIPLADVDALVASGELTDAQSVLGLLLARRRLGFEAGS